MDLAAGAKQVWAWTEHITRDGKPKIVKNCSYPLTSSGCVKRIFTDLAIIDVSDAGLTVIIKNTWLSVSFDANRSTKWLVMT